MLESELTGEEFLSIDVDPTSEKPMIFVKAKEDDEWEFLREANFIEHNLFKHCHDLSSTLKTAQSDLAKIYVGIDRVFRKGHYEQQN